MKTTSLTLVFLTAFLATALAQNCQTNPAVDQLTTGSYTYLINPFNSRTNCYSVSLSSTFNTSQARITSGISQIGQFQTSTAGMDFSLRSYLMGASAAFALIVNNGSWSTVKMSYMISVRSDFYIGTHLSDANQLATCSRQPPFTLTILIPSTANIPISQSLAVLVFLNGLRTPSSSFSFQFTQPIYDHSLKQINMTVASTATSQIEVVFLSYILVDLAQLSSAGYAYTFSLTQTNDQFGISGIVAFNSTSAPATIQHAFFGINSTNSLTCVGFTCSQCISSTSCTSQGGQVVGLQCIKCSSGQSYVSGVGCSCASGQYLINGVCGICSAGTTYNSGSQSCIVNCGSNSYLAGTVCICHAGFYNVSGSCQTCPSGTNYNNSTMTCQSICGSNSFFLGNGCVCHAGYYNISGSCQSCPSGTTYNSNTQTCAVICGANSSPLANSCVCNTGFYNISGLCQSCPVGTIYNSGSQTCISSCGVNQVHNGVNCICSSGYYNISGSCQTCPSGTAYNTITMNCQVIVSCGINSYVSGSSCICSAGYNNISGTCQTCPSGTSYHSASQTCVSTCGSNQVYANGGCTCITGYTMINGVCTLTTTTCGTNMVLLNGICRCLSHLLQYQNSCYSCPANSQVTADQTGCVCLAGYVLSSSYTCVHSVSSVSSTSSSSNGSSSSSGSTGSSKSSGSTGTIYGGSTTINNSTSTNSTAVSSSSSSSSGAMATISPNQTVLINTTIYVNILAFNLPQSITNSSCPNCSNLIIGTLAGNPANVNLSISFIPNTTHQWVAAVTFQTTPFTVVLQLRFNSTFSGSITTAELAQVATISLNPATTPVYHVPVASITTSEDVLDSTKLSNSTEPAEPADPYDSALDFFSQGRE